MNNYELLEKLNTTILKYNSKYYIYINYNNNEIFLDPNDTLLSYNNNDLYNYLLNNIEKPNYIITDLPQYFNANNISFNNEYEVCEFINFNEYNKLNKLQTFEFTKEEIENFRNTFCNIILEDNNVDNTNISNYIYKEVLKYYKNNKQNEVSLGLNLILNNSVTNLSINNQYKTCNCNSQTNNQSNILTNCSDLYDSAMKLYIKQMLGSTDFYKEWLTEESRIEKLLKLIDAYLILNNNINITTENNQSTCNCGTLTSINNCYKEIIITYKQVLEWIKQDKIEENINKIKVYGEEFGNILPQL